MIKQMNFSAPIRQQGLKNCQNEKSASPLATKALTENTDRSRQQHETDGGDAKMQGQQSNNFDYSALIQMLKPVKVATL